MSALEHTLKASQAPLRELPAALLASGPPALQLGPALGPLQPLQHPTCGPTTADDSRWRGSCRGSMPVRGAHALYSSPAPPWIASLAGTSMLKLGGRAATVLGYPDAPYAVGTLLWREQPRDENGRICEQAGNTKDRSGERFPRVVCTPGPSRQTMGTAGSRSPMAVDRKHVRELDSPDTSAQEGPLIARVL